MSTPSPVAAELTAVEQKLIRFAEALTKSVNGTGHPLGVVVDWIDWRGVAEKCDRLLVAHDQGHLADRITTYLSELRGQIEKVRAALAKPRTPKAKTNQLIADLQRLPGAIVNELSARRPATPAPDAKAANAEPPTGALYPMTQSQLAEQVGSAKTIRTWARKAKVKPRKSQGHCYTVAEIRAILRWGADTGKGATKAAAVKILGREAE